MCRDIVVLKATSLAVVPVVDESARFSSEFSGLFQTKHLLVFLRLEVRGPVMFEDERVRIIHAASHVLFRVVIVDDIVVNMEHALFPDEGPRITHVLVVLGDELEEGLILAGFSSSHDASAN